MPFRLPAKGGGGRQLKLSEIYSLPTVQRNGPRNFEIDEDSVGDIQCQEENTTETYLIQEHNGDDDAHRGGQHPDNDEPARIQASSLKPVKNSTGALNAKHVEDEFVRPSIPRPRTEKPFQCDVCGKYFSCKKSLIQHKRLHTGEKPFQCDVCRKRFNCPSNFRKHKLVHSRAMSKIRNYVTSFNPT
ncbi:zinc finger protein 665-like [Frankliniella occidentalis]|uniref:Zinc finger protein 665-like n=1 Tax=Frankliniella occidentalis TaxID=133901 RepID=A0A9C6X5M1_FRAOC|nr:zinc finger protein 665-like [Frankliniella occidentalis]